MAAFGDEKLKFAALTPERIGLQYPHTCHNMASTTGHVSRVRALYKALLKLHHGLPLEMKAIGDQYVKAEFRLHNNVSSKEADVFLSEWTKYYITLAKQLGQRKQHQHIGQHLSPEFLENFQGEQIGQLVELKKESTKPVAKGR